LESVCSAIFLAATGPGAGPFRRTRRIGVLKASSVVSPEWPGGPPDRPAYGPVPPDLAPNHSVKPAFHLALVSSDFEFLFVTCIFIWCCFALLAFFRLFLD
jgi:hypothetical protein